MYGARNTRWQQIKWFVHFRHRQSHHFICYFIHFSATREKQRLLVSSHELKQKKDIKINLGLKWQRYRRLWKLKCFTASSPSFPLILSLTILEPFHARYLCSWYSDVKLHMYNQPALLSCRFFVVHNAFNTVIWLKINAKSWVFLTARTVLQPVIYKPTTEWLGLYN